MDEEKHTDEGYIILARATYKKSKTWLALNPVQKTIMITLLFMANHKDGQWWDSHKKEWVTVKRGQLITSLKNLKKSCGRGVSIQNIRTTLVNLKNMGFLTHQSTNLYSLITIENYDFYQCYENYLTQQLTNHQQSSNKPLTTNNNDNNDKNDNKKDLKDPPPISPSKIKIHYAEFVTLTKEEYQKLIDQFGDEGTGRIIEILDNYKGANGKRYKSDYRAILNWVIDRYQEELSKGVKPNVNRGQNPANTSGSPGPSAESLRLEKLAREQGLIKDGEIQDIDCPF